MIELLSTNRPILSLLAGILGLLVGSFLNVVIYRLPKMMEREWQNQCAELRGDAPLSTETVSLMTPRSQCPRCGHKILALENIPIISWLLLRGKCSACRESISIRYPVVEAVSGILSCYAAWHFGFSWSAAGALIFVWAMIALTGIDFDTQLLPDSITLPLIWLGLLFNLSGTYTTLTSAVIGAASGYVSLWLVYWAFKLATGKEGMGYGDFKLLAALGAWLGWEMLPLTILLSSLVGSVVGIVLIVLTKRSKAVPIPFGPYLATAGLIALFWGQQINRTYLGMLYS